MRASPEISVVIVSYQVRDQLRECLFSVHEALEGRAAEVWVMDNASRDGSAAMVSQEFPWVKLHQNDLNIGFAAATNQGIARTTARYVLLLNPDTIVTGQAIAKLIDFLDAHPEVGAVGPQLVSADGAIQRSDWPFPTFWGTLGKIIGFGGLKRVFSGAKRLVRSWDPGDTRPVNWVCGACLLVRRIAINQIGLLDERFFLYCEETDWCKRLWEAGWPVWLCIGPPVIHLGGQSTIPGDAPAGTPLNFTHYYMSEYLYFVKHEGHVSAATLRALRLLTGHLVFLKWQLLATVRGDSNSRASAQRSKQVLQGLRGAFL